MADITGDIKKLRRLNDIILSIGAAIGAAMFIFGLWIQPTFFDLMKLRGEEAYILDLVGKQGLSPFQIRKLIRTLKQLDDKQINAVTIILEQSISQKELKDIMRIFNNTIEGIKDASKFIEKNKYTEALNCIITLKGQLEVLRIKYKIDTREAESIVLDLEKKWKSKRYP